MLLKEEKKEKAENENNCGSFSCPPQNGRMDSAEFLTHTISYGSYRALLMHVVLKNSSLKKTELSRIRYLVYICAHHHE